MRGKNWFFSLPFVKGRSGEAERDLIKHYTDLLGEGEIVGGGGDIEILRSGGDDIESNFTGLVGGARGIGNSNITGKIEVDGLIGNPQTSTIE